MPDRLAPLRRTAIALGWAAMAVILFATLSPISLRPHISHMPPDIERFIAYVLAGGLLSFGYPRHRWTLLAVLIAVAFGLEWLQTLEATRHGEVHDALVKAAGVALGGALAFLFDYFDAQLRRSA